MAQRRASRPRGGSTLDIGVDMGRWWLVVGACTWACAPKRPSVDSTTAPAAELRVAYARGMVAWQHRDPKGFGKATVPLRPYLRTDPEAAAVMADLLTMWGDYMGVAQVLDPWEPVIREHPVLWRAKGRLWAYQKRGIAWLIKAAEAGEMDLYSEAYRLAPAQRQAAVATRWFRHELAPWQEDDRAWAAYEQGLYDLASEGFGRAMTWVATPYMLDAWIQSAAASCRIGDVWAWSWDQEAWHGGRGWQAPLLRLSAYTGDAELWARLRDVPAQPPLAPMMACDTPDPIPEGCEGLPAALSAWRADPVSMSNTLDYADRLGACEQVDEAVRVLDRALQALRPTEERARIQQRRAWWAAQGDGQ